MYQSLKYSKPIILIVGNCLCPIYIDQYFHNVTLIFILLQIVDNLEHCRLGYYLYCTYSIVCNAIKSNTHFSSL